MKLSSIKESRIIKNKSYGASYDAGEDETKKATPTGEKRGRGRPAKETQPFASSSGASKSLQDILVGKVSSKLAGKGRVFKMKEDVDTLEERPKKDSEAIAAGKDIGEPGKNFEKIAKSAGKEYGSKEAGQRVAGAILKKVLAKKNRNESVELDEASKKHPDDVKSAWSTGKIAYAQTHGGQIYRLNHKALMGKIPEVGDRILPKQHTVIKEDTKSLDEMSMGSKKNSAGKKVEWINHPGLGHSVTVGGEPVHKGFVDHKTAAGLYAKHLGESVDEGVLQKMGLAADNETAKDVLKGIGKETVAGIKEVPSNLVKGAKHTLRILRNPVKAADAAYDK